jgi:DNA-binding CsgD family transcriptional regulator/PAS domain-containing protein
VDINEALLGVIDELYAGALDPARLSSALGHISRIVDSSGGLIYLMNEADQRIIYGGLSNFDLDTRRQFDDAHADQGHYYRRMPVGSPIHMHSLWPIEKMKKTWFYHDVLRKQDVTYGVGALLLRSQRSHGMMVLNRSEHAGPFSEGDLAVLSTLVPHLRRVLQIALEMGAASCRRDLFVSALDTLSIGVIFADARGKPLRVNRAAERIITGNDGLIIRSGRVAAAQIEEDRDLAGLIGSASGRRSGQPFQRGGSCRITRASKKLPWLLLVTPCSDMQRCAFAPELPACVIFIRDPSAQSPGGVERLRQLFGLTHQEAKIAIAAAEGHGIAHVADEMGLSALTVRNHLQRVFAKTSTNRQAELTRLVAPFTIEPEHATLRGE